MDHPHPGLKYVTLDGLDESKTTLEDFKVVDSAGDQLGKLEGFIINTPQARSYSGFDLEKFAAMTAEELDRMAADIAEVSKVEGFDQTPESVAGRKR